MTARIGFCCKFLEETPTGQISVPELNTRSTTVVWLNRQSRDVAEQRLWDIMVHNIEATRKLVERVGTLPAELRMVRLGSDICPVYTEPTWGYFWHRADVRAYAERGLSEVGEIARSADVRLSFHPGQFCCIVSDKSDVVDRSIDELEYHADMARWMGYGKTFQDFKINVHLSGKRKAFGFSDAYGRMSSELRNCLTIENDEYQAGLDDILRLGDKVALVLDIHHHLIHSGQYITVNDDRIKQIQDSWRGVRPVIHYSQCREEYLLGEEGLPDLHRLSDKVGKSKLRAHSDFYKHRPTNDWAFTHYSWADVMAECKAKNLASIDLFNRWKECI